MTTRARQGLTSKVALPAPSTKQAIAGVLPNQALPASLTDERGLAALATHVPDAPLVPDFAGGQGPSDTQLTSAASLPAEPRRNGHRPHD